MTNATDEDADDGPSFREVLFDADGNFRLDRVWNAIRGRTASTPDKLPWFALGLVAAVVGGVIWGSVYSSAPVLETLGWALLVYFGIVLAEIVISVSAYQWDEETAIERLRSEYAAGEYDMEEFQRRVDRVHREGPASVWSDDSAAVEGERDPTVILEERFARGEIDEDEFRRGMEVLGEPVEVAGGEETDRDRVLESE